MRRSRRRALLLGCLALFFAILTGSMVSKYVREVRAEVGPLVGVLEVKRTIPEGTTLTYENASRYVAVRQVATRYAPRRSFRQAEHVMGLTTVSEVPDGVYLSPGHLGEGAAAPAPPIAEGERAVEIAVAGGRSLASQIGVGSRADVLVSEEAQAGGRTYVALQDVEILSLAAADGSVGGMEDSAGTVVALRVTPKQAVMLTAAQNFAKEIRLVPRASGDRGRVSEDGYEVKSQ